MADEADRLDAAAGWWRLFNGRLAPDQRVEMPMLTGSMVPLLPVGSILVIAGAGDRACRVGDVVVYRDGERLVAHRLLLGWPPGRARVFLQAGDGVSPVAWIASTAILGLVIAVRYTDQATRDEITRDEITRDEITRDLRQPAAQREGRRLARRRLHNLIWAPLRGPLGRGRAWLRRR